MQVVTSVQPVSVALQTWRVAPEHRYWFCAQTGTTHWPLLHTGVAGVPLQSADPEQPQLPDAGRQIGRVPEQDGRLTHPVPSALHVWGTLPEHRWSSAGMHTAQTASGRGPTQPLAHGAAEPQ